MRGGSARRMISATVASVYLPHLYGEDVLVVALHLKG